MPLSVPSLLSGIMHGTRTAVLGFMYAHGYYALFVLMLLESASLPIPSEVVLPLAGYLGAVHAFNVYVAFIVALLAGVLGMGIDYFIAYYLGKEVVYKHLRRFRIKRRHLEAFDRWFEGNGAFTVFIGRLLPEIRGVISFPAGFALMPKKKFFLYSFAGTVIWDAALMTFGYYALNVSNIYITMISVALFAIALYVLYSIAMKKMKG